MLQYEVNAVLYMKIYVCVYIYILNNMFQFGQLHYEFNNGLSV